MKNKIVRTLFYIIVITYAAMTLFPFLWSFVTSLKPTPETLNFGIPWDKLSFKNYSFLLTNKNLKFGRWLFNSIFVAAITTGSSLFLNSLAGYSLARIDFKGKEFFFYIILAVMMVPGQVVLIPQFLLVNKLGWVNSYLGLVCTSLTSSYGIFLMRQFFMSIPRAIEEAAVIDGLGRFGIFRKIVLPLAKPAFATQFIFMFNGNWNSLLWPSIVGRTPNYYTLPVGLNSFYGQYYQLWDQVMAGVMILTIPTIIIFIVFQKQFVGGVTSSGVKG